MDLIHSDHRLDVESRHQEDVVDFRHWDPSVFMDSGLGTEGCVYVLCTYVCLCKKKNKEGAEVHQHPVFIFIMYNYLVIPDGRDGGFSKKAEPARLPAIVEW